MTGNGDKPAISWNNVIVGWILIAFAMLGGVLAFNDRIQATNDRMQDLTSKLREQIQVAHDNNAKNINENTAQIAALRAEVAGNEEDRKTDLAELLRIRGLIDSLEKEIDGKRR